MFACAIAALAGLLLVVATPAAGAPPWLPVGPGSLNASTAAAASSPDAAMVGTVPHVAWTEAGAIYAKAQSGSTWASVGGRINGTGAGAGSRLGSDGTRPWATYVEDVGGVNQVFVRRWDGASWVAQGGALNIAAGTSTERPDIAFSGTTPYVVWRENSAPPRGYVKRWDGASWVSMGGSINVDNTRDLGAPAIAVDGTTPYVAFQQWNGTKWQINVRRWDGSAWVTLGGSLNVNTAQNAWAPRIALDGATPYVIWYEDDAAGRFVYVKRWSGTAWESVGGALNPYYAFTTDIAIQGGVVHATWAEWNNSNYEQVAARWTGSQWRQIGGGLNVDHMAPASAGMLMMNGSEPWVAWSEDLATFRQVYVKRYAPNNSMVGPLTNVAVVTTPSQVELRWTNPADANYAGTRIYRSTTQGELGTLAGTVLTGATPNNAFVDTSVAADTTYFYHLVAYDTLGNERESVYETGESYQSPRRYGVGVATDGTKVYSFGGCANCTVLDDIWTYDPATDLMTKQAAVLPSPRVRVRATWVGGTVNKAFVLGGDDATAVLSDIVTYDPATGAVTTTGNMPGPRQEGAVAYAPNTDRIYYFGGMNAGGSTKYDTIYQVDPATGAGSDTGIKLPQATARMNAVYWPADGCIYVIGGSLADNSPSDKIVRFCPATGTVTNLALTLPAARTELAVTAGTDEIFLMGGDSGGYVREILGFSPSAGTILRHAATLPIPQVTFTAEGVTGSSIYAVSPYPRSHKVTQLALGSLVRARTSKPPATPSNLTPAAGSPVAPGAVTVTSSAFSDPDPGDTHSASQWQVRTSAGTYASPAWDSGTTTTSLTSATSSALSTDGTYFFRVRHRDSNFGWSAWSTETSFVVDSTAPPEIALVSPAAGATVSGQPLLVATYQDTAPGSAGSIQFQACPDSACATITSSGSSGSGIPSGSNGSWTTSGLAAGTWYWRARAVDGMSLAGPWSATRSVVIAGNPPTAVPISPADNAWVGSQRPVLTARLDDLESNPGILTFELCSTAAADPWSANCAPAAYQSGTSLPNIASGAHGAWEPTNALAEGTWYWRVRGDDGAIGPWSATRTLRVDSVSPPPPTGVTAVRSGVGKITITWGAVTDPAPSSGSITYDVETSTDGVTWSAACTAITTTSCVKTGLGGQELVQVRVRACDFAGNCSAWSGASASTGAGYFLRPTASTLLGTPNKLASLPPAGTVDTVTSVRHHNSSGWFVIVPGVTNSAEPKVALEPASTPHGAPTGAGWVIDDYAGKTAAAGIVDVGITTASNNGSGVGALQCRLYKVTTSGGTIASSTFLEKQMVAGDVVDGLGATQRTCSLTGLAAKTVFAANEALYVELWLQVTTAGAAGSTLTLSVNDGSSFIQAPAAGVAPTTPAFVSPADAATVSLTPTLVATYAHPAGVKGAVEYQVATDSAFTSIVATGSSSVVAAGSDASWTAPQLAGGTTHYWRVRGIDASGLDSPWSTTGWAFTTTTPPAAPSPTSPTGGGSAGTTKPLLQAGAFSDADAGDTHGASEWQVRTATGSYATPAAESGVTSTSLTSWQVPAGQLVDGGAHAWRVRYRDSHGAWSAWSAEATFIAGATMTLGVDAATASLGLLAANVDAAASTVVSVATNSVTGYDLSISDSSDTTSLATSPAGAFADWTGTSATPTAWSAGTSGPDGFFGATVFATGGTAEPKLSKWGTGTSATDFAANLYAGIPQTGGTLLHQRTSATSGTETISIGWRGTPSATTPPGTYSDVVTVTVVARP